MNLSFAFIYAIGSIVCHQLPDRSFFVDGRQLPVCARCTGLYLSGAAGLVMWCAFRAGAGGRRIAIAPRRAVEVLAVAAIPTVLSVASGAVGAWDGSNTTRALLAVPLGLVAGAAVAAVFTKDLR